MKRTYSVLLILVTLLTTALVATRTVLASPQHRGTSVLTGVVIGPNDRPVAHAAVTYQSSAGMSAHAVHTDAHGRFTILKLPGDNYDVRASANGIFSEWEKNISIRSGETKSITLHLIHAKKMPKGAMAASKNH
jgi:hypothetical protein